MIVRPATIDDCPPMVELLNEIIAIGGTTANVTPWTTAQMVEKMQTNTDRSSWVVAVKGGVLMGYQYFQPHPDLPPEAPSIATFVRVGAVKMGVGSAMFTETLSAAKRLGYTWINATIRADNTGGQAYYASRGFEIWDVNENTALEDGTPTTKISRRYDL